MKIEAYSEKAPLTGEWIDRISERIGEFLQPLHMERTNALRIRLALEEALLRWRDHFGEETEVALELGSRWRRPFITLRLEGENYDPLINRGSELGEWAGALLSGIGLIPSHSYQQGVNVLQLRLKRPRLNPAPMLLMSVATGLLLGLLSKSLIPAETQEIILRTVLDPIQNTFFRILNAVGSPVIFLSVLVAVCGVGTVATMGKSGRRLIFRFMLFSILAALIAAGVSTAFLRPGLGKAALNGTQFSGTIDYFLHVFPSDMLSPLIQGNSPQLILIAFVLGNALLVAGRQADSLVHIVEQANTVGLVLADWVSRLTPLFVVILLVLGIWSGSLDMLLGIWRPLLLLCAVSALILILSLAAASIRERISIKKLAGKMLASFGIAFRKASVDAAFGASQLCCEKRLGISKSLVSFGMPLGLVIYMPATTIACMVFSVYAARCCGVNVSAVWLVMALVLSVTFMAATPPLAGVTLLSYSVIFTQLGIPGTMIPVAMVADILFGFVSAAVNQALLQLELLREANRTGALNREILNG